MTWIPDAFLIANGFFDEVTNARYAPATYADHGTGLFFVGLEGNGQIYAFALNHVTGAATKVATISSSFGGIMGMEPGDLPSYEARERERFRRPRCQPANRASQLRLRGVQASRTWNSHASEYPRLFKTHRPDV